MNDQVLLMISNDPNILREGSAVRMRQVEYAKGYKEVHIIILDEVKSEKLKVKSEAQGVLSRESVIGPNCWAYSTNSSSKIFAPFTAMRLGRFLVEKRGVTNITCQDPFLTGMAGVGLKKQFPQLGLEIQLHTDIGSPYFTYNFGNKVRKFLALNYLPKADHVRVVSNKIKTFLIEKLAIDATKIEVRPIGVDTDKIKNAPIVESFDLHKKYPQFEKIILMASRLEQEKNIEYALDVFNEVSNKFPKAGLVIVGSGSRKSNLEAQYSRFSLKDSVVFEGWADQMTLYSYYKTANLFLNTSLFEGYGMTLVEAHAAGCPIVSTDVGIAQEVGAKIIPFGDVKSAAQIVAGALKI